MNNHIVIMAGGVGSRFWPMSTVERPKQFIDVLGVGRSLLQLTYDRFAGICPPERVWVVTNRKYFALVHEQLPDVPEGNILLEPCRRNTAPCIAYVSWRIKAIDPKANVVVTPSDAFVANVEEFRRVVGQCLKFTGETDAIVTLGMEATRPETGYGYIQADLGSPSARNKEIFRVDSFREKPDLQTATQYIRQNNFFWNAGIFIWSVGTIVNAFRVYQPSISRVFESMLDIYGTEEEQRQIDLRYPECESISVDYAIMEKAEEIFVCPARSDGPTSARGAVCSCRPSTTSTATRSSDRTSRCLTRKTTSCIPHKRKKWSFKASKDISWPRKTTPYLYANSRKSSASNNSAENKQTQRWIKKRPSSRASQDRTALIWPNFCWKRI